MPRFDISEQYKQRPIIQLAPLVDIAFWALILFMVIAVFSQRESELDINVPQSKVAKDGSLSAGKIIINITRVGSFIVNGKKLNGAGLEDVLNKVTKLFPNSQVVIRADEMTYHKFIVQALDACSNAHISNISFSTVTQENK